MLILFFNLHCLILIPFIVSMTKFDANTTLKRLRNRYRLVVMNEDTYEEVVKFRLNRVSVYVALCTLFVLLVGLTVALIMFTKLKYYVPGYGDVKQVREYRQLQVRADSIENDLKKKEKYVSDLHKVLEGKIPQLDTTKLAIPKLEKSDE